MDCWGYLDKSKEYERKRAHLVPAWVEAWILGAVVVSFVGGRLLHCFIQSGPIGPCFSTGMPRILSMSLHSAALLLGVWAGPRLGLRFDNKPLGWMSGALLVVVVSAVLVWTGFPIGGP